MRKILVPMLVASSLLIACSKEDGAPGNENAAKMQGNWKFINISVDSRNEDIENGSSPVFRTITTNAYTTTNNLGNLNITTNEIISTGVGYTASGTAYYKIYEGAVLFDEGNFPFSTTIPPNNGRSGYRFISTDSVQIDPGSFGNNSTTASKARVTFNGDTLMLTSRGSESKQVNQQGATYTRNTVANTITRLKRM
jgi:hypothetical protein